MAEPELPEPVLARWQPLRAGLVDLFYYDAEEFWFRDGRLLLRGNNGTGKSKVLALMLPFLFDGDLSPHRVEPDADPKKRMEWNLLLGGAHPYPERLGYTWLEFGRVDDDGTPRFLTLGCGMKAVAGKGITSNWFFLSQERMGRGLYLVDAAGSALTKDRLTDALGATGTRFDRAIDYRRSVDEALFGLGEQRYGALVNLLIQLRQPQLSKRPSEKALSAALTESLPPLDQAVLADVAEAFRSLQDDRDELEDLREARAGTRSFFTHYRTYARLASRRRAAGPRQAQSHYEKVSRELAEAEDALADAQERLTGARADITELDTQHHRLTERDSALKDSTAMNSARELTQAGKDAERLQAEATRAATEERSAAAAVDIWRTRTAEAEQTTQQASKARGHAVAVCAQHATAATIDRGHAAIIAGLDSPTDAAVATAARAASSLAGTRKQAIRHLRTLITALTKARDVLAGRRNRVDELLSRATELESRRSDAEHAVADEAAALVHAVRQHLQQATELRVADVPAVCDELTEWAQRLDGGNPAAVAVRASASSASDALSRADAALHSTEKEVSAHTAELETERVRLASGEVRAPAPPRTRAADSRRGRPGAPLWQLVDFADAVRSSDRAGLEAALEASGVLDAWVSPDGGVDVADTRLTAGEPVAGASLAQLLTVAVDREDTDADALGDDVVHAVLASIGVGAALGSGTWVGADGRFRTGVIVGAWTKPTAEFIGAGAREQARRARIAELDAELAQVREKLGQIRAQRQALAERRRALETEVAATPEDNALRRAHTAVSVLNRELRVLDQQRTEADEAVITATQSADDAEAQLTTDATDAALPADAAALDDVADALQQYEVSLGTLWPAYRAEHTSYAQLAQARDELTQHEDRLAERSTRAADARRAADGGAERYTTLRATVGAAVEELERALHQVQSDLTDNRRHYRAAEQRRDHALSAEGNAEGRRGALAGSLEEARVQRAAAAESLRRFVTTGLLAVALPELETPNPDEAWAPDPTVRLARAIDRDLSEVSEEDTAWERAQRRVTEEHKELADVLSRHGNRTSAQLLDEGIVVEVVFRGKATTVPELALVLDTEVAERERLLTEREREILENHLVSEVASSLHELISAAESQVARMNHELDARPTSTGMRLRLYWQARADGPTGLEAAQRQLRQTADAWSEADRQAVGTFLQEQITEARATNLGGTWQQHLTTALDYRQWSEFTIKREQNGQWRSASGPASGGERVLAASVPLFAAASAHYGSAGNPHAPRLVTLDEAFAGVDDNARAKYLGLLAAFDLDVVMTSEREWGCYPEVPGIAIAQLSRHGDVPAVLVTHWEWDGVGRAEVQRPHALATVSEPRPPAAETQDALWG